MAQDDADRFRSLFESWGDEPVLFLVDGSFSHDLLLEKVRAVQRARTWMTDRVAFDGVTSHYLEGLIRSLPSINGKMYEALGALVQTNPSRFAVLSLDCRGLLQKHFRGIPHEFIESAGRLDSFPWVVELCGTIPTYQYSSGRDLSVFLPALRTIAPSHVVVLEGDRGSRGGSHIVHTLQTAGVALDVNRISPFGEAGDRGGTTFVAGAVPLLRRLAAGPPVSPALPDLPDLPAPVPAPRGGIPHAIPRLLPSTRAGMVRQHLALGAGEPLLPTGVSPTGEQAALTTALFRLRRVRADAIAFSRTHGADPSLGGGEREEGGLTLGGVIAAGVAAVVREAMNPSDGGSMPLTQYGLDQLERDTYINGAGLRVPRPPHMRPPARRSLPSAPREGAVEELDSGSDSDDGDSDSDGGSGSDGGEAAPAQRPEPDLDPELDIVLAEEQSGSWGSCRICFDRRAAVQYDCGHADCRACYVGWRRGQHEKGLPHTCPQCRATAGPPRALLI